MPATLPIWLVAVGAVAAASIVTAPIRRRRKRDRGLPNDADLEALATTYLEEQAKHWPTLVASGHLEAATRDNATALRDQFKQLFVADVGLKLDALVDSLPANLKLAMVYLRYSSDNSNARSLDQQLINVLRRAEQEKVFVPWALVFADAGITGRHVDRQGYQLAKRTIEKAPGRVRALICDEVSRTNRYCIEALRLGEIVQRNRRILLGATDGFDSRNTDSQLILTIFSAIYEWFSTQLGKKVERGMDFAFGEGDVIGRIATGYAKVVKRDAKGDVVLRKNGLPKHVRVIDEEAAAWVRKAFILFVNERWKISRICSHFNRHSACGSTKWNPDKLKKVLKRELYIGVDYYGKSKNVVDRDTGIIKVEKIPQPEWKRREVPDLRLVSDDVFNAAKKRLDEGSAAYGEKSDSPTLTKRQDYAPVSLVPLTCGYCGNRLVTARGGKYRSHSCPNGRVHKDGCQLDGCKSDRIVNDAIFGFITTHLVTNDVLASLVDRASVFLTAQANEPAPDTEAIKKEIASLNRKIPRLVDQLEEVDDEGLPQVKQRLNQRRSELLSAKAELARMDAAAQPVPPMVTVDLVREVVADLPKFLQEDVSAVAPVVAQMLGQVKITQKREEGRRGAKWFAEFTFNHVPVLLELAKRRDCPSVDTWEYLHSREWTTAHLDPESGVSSGKTHRIEIQKVPDYERLAPVIGPLHAEGVSVVVLGSKYGLSVNSVYAAVEFFESGERPKYKPKRKSSQPRKQSARPMIYKTIAQDVIDRCDKGQSINAIARDLDVHVRTIQRAYDYLRPQDADEAVAEGRRMKRRVQRSKFTPELKARVRSLYFNGSSPAEIVDITGVSRSSVRRILSEKTTED